MATAIATQQPNSGYSMGGTNKPTHDFQTLVLSCNKDGMDSLRKGHYKAAFEQLKYAEAILIANQKEGENTSLLAVTCNNLGCYYKKVGKMHAALSYLRRALKIEISLNTDAITVAGTHLNICAILSKLEKHDKAVQHSLCALELISHRINTDEQNVSSDDYSVLAIAYHNVAVERDFLQQFDQAAMAYQQGFQIAKRCLGDQHPLTQTLGKNCDAVLQKTTKYTKDKSLAVNRRPPPVDAGLTPRLPEISPSDSSSAHPDTKPMPAKNPILTQAADWATEDTAWTSFARDALHDSPQALPPPASTTAPQQSSALSRDLSLPEDIAPVNTTNPPKALGTLSTLKDFSVPDIKDASLPVTVLARSPREDAESMMNVIDDERDGKKRSPMRSAPHDFRPNRLIKGSTRTSLYLRRTGMFTQTTHRDAVITSKKSGDQSKPWKNQFIQKTAAERIQRAWRAWHKYCMEHQDWMTTTRICATMIQARWRSYHVRRQKLDKAAGVIQRHIRGFLVRLVLKRHTAAVTIQRHVVGLLTRKQLWRLGFAAMDMQRLARGYLARRNVKELHGKMTRLVIILQRGVRGWIGKRMAADRREKLRKYQLIVQCVVDIQRIFRGNQGRKKAATRSLDYSRELETHQAATKLQAMSRRDQATKKVNKIRQDKITKMAYSATFVRKLWLAYITRKRYLELKKEFASHVDAIVTMQRYVRGFLVRLRMWREAIRAEEELWAVVEIQRVWRGFLGKKRWERAYEKVWAKEMASYKLQCLVRGWLARLRVNRARRKIARSEFEGARARFKSAQRIQAFIRGVLVRKVIRAWRAKIVAAVVHIQRVARGHALRCKLWNQVMAQRAAMIQSVVRGFLVRRRMIKLFAKVILIQNAYRHWRSKPKNFRKKKEAERELRQKKAGVIQKQYKKRSEEQKKKEIQKQEGSA